MTDGHDRHDRDELVELISRYANMPDSRNWDDLPRSVLCDEFTCDFSSLGVPVATGSFGTRMQVHLVNDGPVTIVLG